MIKISKNKKKIIRYTKILADKICLLIAEGKNLRQIAKEEISELPSRKTIHEWLIKHKYFGDQYARAKMIGMEVRFEEMIDLAKNEEDVQRARLMIDVIKWQLSKELPKKYGEKLDMTSDGEKLIINFGTAKSQFVKNKNEKRNNRNI